ncbi:MAG: hypothetical protein WCF06_15775 [Nitrososphaeraceae archaeon]
MVDNLVKYYTSSIFIAPTCFVAISNEIALAVGEYIITMKTELHLADYYGQDLILVSKLSTYTGNNKLFKLMTRLDVRAFTNSFRKTNVSDSINGLGVITLLRFFKWHTFQI